jgi:hypothetical protein
MHYVSIYPCVCLYGIIGLGSLRSRMKLTGRKRDVFKFWRYLVNRGLAQTTRSCFPSWRVTSTTCVPESSSNRITPKLQTSVFTDNPPVNAYSGATYLKQRIQNEQTHGYVHEKIYADMYAEFSEPHLGRRIIQQKKNNKYS